MEEALKQATEQTHKQMIDEQTKTGQTPSLVQSKVMTQLQQKQKLIYPFILSGILLPCHLLVRTLMKKMLITLF